MLSAGMFCSVCGRAITSNYIQSNGKVFCSESCFQQSLPICAYCGKHSAAGAVFNGTGADGEQVANVFICDDCSNKPRCPSCGIPAGTIQLRDGKLYCKRCFPKLVLTHERANQLVEYARSLMYQRFGMFTSGGIRVTFVVRDNTSTVQQLGEFQHQVRLRANGQIIAETKTIQLAYGTTDDQFMEIITHELTHEFIARNYPRLVDNAVVNEGTAEFVASKMNDLLGKSSRNARMWNNTLPSYGDGFRMIYGLTRGRIENLRGVLGRLPQR